MRGGFVICSVVGSLFLRIYFEDALRSNFLLQTADANNMFVPQNRCKNPSPRYIKFRIKNVALT